MEKGCPFVFWGCEIERTDSEWDEVSHQSRGRDTGGDQHHAPDDEQFVALQFGTGSQSFEKYIDTEDEDQHHEDDSDRHVVPGKVGAADVEIVIRCDEALADHCADTDQYTPRCDTAISGLRGVRGILRRERRCHKVCICQLITSEVGP